MCSEGTQLDKSVLIGQELKENSRHKDRYDAFWRPKFVFIFFQLVSKWYTKKFYCLFWKVWIMLLEISSLSFKFCVYVIRSESKKMIHIYSLPLPGKYILGYIDFPYQFGILSMSTFCWFDKFSIKINIIYLILTKESVSR